MLLNSPYMCGAIAIIASTSAIDGILGPADAVPFPRMWAGLQYLAATLESVSSF
jgi:hypothetical protein